VRDVCGGGAAGILWKVYRSPCRGWHPEHPCCLRCSAGARRACRQSARLL